MRLRNLDIAVAAFFVIAAELEVWLWWTPVEQGPKAVAAVFGGLLGIALAWRRVAPFATQLIMAAIVIVWTLVQVPQGSLTPWFMMIVAAYSVAAYAGLVRSLVGLAANWAAWILFAAVTTNSVADYSFILGFVTGGGGGASWCGSASSRSRWREPRRNEPTSAPNGRPRMNGNGSRTSCTTSSRTA